MKLNMKIAVLFALLLASMSWGDYVNKLFLSYGSSSSAKSIIADSTPYFVTNVAGATYSTSQDDAQDLLANTGCGKGCFAYMGFTTTPYLKNLNGTTHVLPITNIIVKEFSKGATIPKQFIDYPGDAGHYATYYRLYQYKKTKDGLVSLEDNDICNNGCNSERRVYIYYTRDYVDGEVVYDVKASAESIHGYEKRGVDLTGGKGEKPIYLYVNRRAPDKFGGTFDPLPTVRSGGVWSIHNLTFTGFNRVLMENLGTPVGDHIDHVEYSVYDGKYYNGSYLQLNGSWSRSIPEALHAGVYRVFVKIVSSNRFYADFLYGMNDGNKLQTTISKATELKGTVREPDANMNFVKKDYYLYSAKFYNQLNENYNAITDPEPTNYYSGDVVKLAWSSPCASNDMMPIYYSKDGGDYTYYGYSGALKSGTYSFFAILEDRIVDVGSDCEPMDYQQFASFTIKKSKMTFDANEGNFSGSPEYIIEDETGNSITKPANPKRTGYSFTGWDKAIPSTIPRGENTYTAQWKINQYTITLYANGGQFSNGESTMEITQNYNTSITRPANPKKTDYTFNGWRQTIPAGRIGAKIPTKMPAMNMTFVAQWTYNRFKVNMPEQMEVVSGDIADDGTYLKGSTVKFRAKLGYAVRGDLTYNGASVVPDKNGVYSIKVAGEDADVVAEMVEDHGAIQIVADHSKAYIDGDKTSLAANVPTSTDVAAVEMTRTFTPYSTTTITFPFTIDLEYVWGGVFCKFLGMDKSGFKYTARLMFISTELKANEPYVFVPLDEHISIDLPAGETVAIKTEEKSVKFGDWSFNSLYHEKVWKDGVSEGDVEGAVGYCFNPSDEEVDGVSGSFAKLKSGSVGSMQAYIAYAKNAPQAVRSTVNVAKSTKSVFDIDDLPDEIGIEVVTEDKKTVALGKMNTVTGKIKLNAWFDMKGNLLKSKPTAKGVYFYNGNQVIVK